MFSVSISFSLNFRLCSLSGLLWLMTFQLFIIFHCPFYSLTLLRFRLLLSETSASSCTTATRWLEWSFSIAFLINDEAFYLFFNSRLHSHSACRNYYVSILRCNACTESNVRAFSDNCLWSSRISKWSLLIISGYALIYLRLSSRRPISA